MKIINHLDSTRNIGSRFTNPEIFNQFQACETIAELQELYSRVSPYAYNVDQRVVMVMGMDLAFLSGDTIIWNGTDFVVKKDAIVKVNANNFPVNYKILNPSDNSVSTESVDVSDHWDSGGDAEYMFYNNYVTNRHCPALYQLDECDFYIDYTLLGKQRSQTGVTMPDNFEEYWYGNYKSFLNNKKITGDGKRIVCSYLSCLISLTCSVYDRTVDQSRFTYDDCDIVSYSRVNANLNTDKVMTAAFVLSMNIMEQFYATYVDDLGDTKANNTRPFLFFRDNSDVDSDFKKLYFEDILIYTLPYFKRIFMLPDNNDYTTVFIERTTSDDAICYIPVPILLKVNEQTGIGYSADMIDSRDCKYPYREFISDPHTIAASDIDSILQFKDYSHTKINSISERDAILTKVATEFTSGNSNNIDKMTEIVKFRQNCDANGTPFNVIAYPSASYRRLSNIRTIIPQNDTYKNFYSDMYNRSRSQTREQYYEPFGMHNIDNYEPNMLYQNTSLDYTSSELISMSAPSSVTITKTNGDYWGNPSGEWTKLTWSDNCHVHPWLFARTKGINLPTASARKCIITITDNNHDEHKYLLVCYNSFAPQVASISTSHAKKTQSFTWVERHFIGSTDHTASFVAEVYHTGKAECIDYFSGNNVYFLDIDEVTNEGNGFSYEVYSLANVVDGESAILNKSISDIKASYSSYKLNANDIGDHIGSVNVSDGQIVIDTGILRNYPYIESYNVSESTVNLISCFREGASERYTSRDTYNFSAYKHSGSFIKPSNANVADVIDIDLDSVISSWNDAISSSDASGISLTIETKVEYSNTRNSVAGTVYANSPYTQLIASVPQKMTLTNTTATSSYNEVNRRATHLDVEELSIPFASFMKSNGDIVYGYLLRQRSKIVNCSYDAESHALFMDYHALADTNDYSELSAEVGYRSNYTLGYCLACPDTGMYVESLEEYVEECGRGDYNIVLLSGGKSFSHDVVLQNVSTTENDHGNIVSGSHISEVYIKVDPEDASGVSIGKLFLSDTTNATANLDYTSGAIGVCAEFYKLTIDSTYTHSFNQRLASNLEKGLITQLSNNVLTMADNYKDDDYSNIKQTLLRSVYKHFSQLDSILDEVILNGVDESFCKPTLYQAKAEFDAMNCLALDLVINNYSKVATLFSNITNVAGSIKSKVVSIGSKLKQTVKSRVGAISLTHPATRDNISSRLSSVEHINVHSVTDDISSLLVSIDSGYKINSKYLDTAGNLIPTLVSAVECNNGEDALLPNDFIIPDTSEITSSALHIPSNITSEYFNEIVELRNTLDTEILGKKELLKTLISSSDAEEIGDYQIQLIVPSVEFTTFSDANPDLSFSTLTEFTSLNDNDEEESYRVISCKDRLDNLSNIHMPDSLHFLNSKLGMGELQPAIDYNLSEFSAIKDGIDYLKQVSADGIDSMTQLPINPKISESDFTLLNFVPNSLISDVTDIGATGSDINASLNIQFNVTNDEEDEYGISDNTLKNIAKGYTSTLREKYAVIRNNIDNSREACSTVLTGYFNGILEDAANEYETCYYASDELAHNITDSDGSAQSANAATASVGEALDGTVAEINQSIDVVAANYGETSGSLKEVFNTVKLNVTSYKNTLLTRMASSQVISGLSSGMSVFLDTITSAASNVKNAMGAAITRMTSAYKTITNSSFISEDADSNSNYRNDFDLDALYAALGFVGKKGLSILGTGCLVLNNIVTKGSNAVRSFVKSTLYDGASISYRLSGFETIDVVAYQQRYSINDFAMTYSDIYRNVILPFALRYSKIFTISVQYSGMFIFYTYYPEADSIIVRMSPKIYDVSLNSHNDTEVFLGIARSYSTTIDVINYINKRILEEIPNLFNSLKTIHSNHSMSYYINTDDEVQYYSTYIDKKEIEDIAEAACDAPYVRQNATADSIMGWSGLIAGAGAAVAMTGAVIPGAIIAGVGAVGMAAASIYERATDVTSMDEVISTALEDITYGNAMITNTELYVLIKAFPEVACLYIADHLEKFSQRNLIHAGDGAATPQGNYIVLGFSRGEPKIALHLRTDYEMTIIRLLKMAVIGVAATAITAGMLKVTKTARLNRKVDKLNAEAWCLDQKSPTYAKDQLKIQKKLRKKSAKLDGLSSEAVQEISKVTNFDLPNGQDVMGYAIVGANLSGHTEVADKIATLTTASEEQAAISENYSKILQANTALTSLLTTIGDSSTEGTLMFDMAQLQNIIGSPVDNTGIAGKVEAINAALGDDSQSGSILYKLAALAVVVGGIATAANQIHDLVTDMNMKKLLKQAYKEAGFNDDVANALADSFLTKGYTPTA